MRSVDIHMGRLFGSNPKDHVMNSYEQKQEDRRQRLLARSDAKRQEAERRFRMSGEGLPPSGEPIKVGHHSEGRHRRAIERSWDNLGRSVKASEEADRLASRAHSVGKGGISSDDPDAIEKLKKKLAKLKEMQALKKRGNAAYKKGGETALREVVGDKIADAVISLLAQSWYGKKPFPSYDLTNSNANMKRIRERIAQLERDRAAKPATDIEGEGFIIHENVDANRIQIIFDDKPGQEMRLRLKKYAFRWSPSQGAWQRHLNNAGRHAAKAAMRIETS